MRAFSLSAPALLAALCMMSRAALQVHCGHMQSRRSGPGGPQEVHPRASSNRPLNFDSASQWSNFGAARHYNSIPTASLRGSREQIEKEAAAAAAAAGAAAAEPGEATRGPPSPLFQLLQLNNPEVESSTQPPAPSRPWFVDDINALLFHPPASQEEEEDQVE
ncbi:hypothetical protein Emag_002233 [Eimeria magna]